MLLAPVYLTESTFYYGVKYNTINQKKKKKKKNAVINSAYI